MKVAETVGGIALGLVLASLPFLRYRFGDPHPTAHADHTPHRGGELVMVGDVHLELVRQGDGVMVCASDAYRRPIEAAAGAVRLSDRAAPLVASGDCLHAAVGDADGPIEVTVRFADGREATVGFAERSGPEG